MKVILQDNVQKLGKAGEVVEIKRGYYRNYLEPRGLAVLATKGTLKKREEDMAAYQRKADKAHQEAVELGARVSALPTLTLQVKAGETGKLYGKVTNKDITSLIEKHLGHEIDKRLVKSPDINALGSYKATVKLTPEVQAEVKIDIILEGSVVKEAAAPAAAAEASEEAQGKPEEDATLEIED
ncbi:MAG: 50S ribosomal protein L9 [Candidatus Obscuribacterales bacterium]|nr:50S ribosomal protein L9 [Candidatus Obscuribacterales bacterium]